MCPCCKKTYDPHCPICTLRVSLEALGMSAEKVAAIVAEAAQSAPVPNQA
ncbi:MAG: hypothetical protein IJ646_06570 [Clostridia bacterium]|nr:hypothetical protein [Clostridia bacterium]